jgi:hypothetical protein
MVCEEVVDQIPVRTCRYVDEVVPRQVAVRTCRMVQEECVRRVPVRTCRMVTETVVQHVPYCETHQEQYVVNQRVARCVARQVPYTVTQCVPRCVERQVAFEQCYLVPQTVCSSVCSSGCADGGNCSVAPDAANPQPIPQDTNSPIKPRTQPEDEPGAEPRPKPAAKPATAAAPPCALHTINRWLVIASIPHGVPSRLVAVQRRRFVLPFLKADFIIASRQLILPAPTGWGFGMYPPLKREPRRRRQTKQAKANMSSWILQRRSRQMMLDRPQTNGGPEHISLSLASRIAHEHSGKRANRITRSQPACGMK